ncbi:female-specific histamine-binding protein 2 [Rhipicephalus sanguineus]|uniref:female-specific histamine-binding protein 2 n=1 Tax=Rhipicephalus sanguineus TaxID=34632 RepID=UPI00189546BE|nr:female-specific histamine-binding protein 2 [Rhipicephalus sanguineus]
MKFVVLSLALALVVSQAKGQNPVWADEEKFGANQDAWESLKADASSPYYMLLATYTDDPVWGRDFTCLKVQATDVNEAEKSVQAKITYNHEQEASYKTSNEKIYADFLFDYKKANAITYKTEDGRTFTDALVYSGGNCDVFYVPPTADLPSGGYELWATDYDDIPDSCLDKFLEYSENFDIRAVYTSECP